MKLILSETERRGLDTALFVLVAVLVIYFFVTK